MVPGYILLSLLSLYIGYVCATESNKKEIKREENVQHVYLHALMWDSVMWFTILSMYFIFFLWNTSSLVQGQLIYIYNIHIYFYNKILENIPSVAVAVVTIHVTNMFIIWS